MIDVNQWFLISSWLSHSHGWCLTVVDDGWPWWFLTIGVFDSSVSDAWCWGMIVHDGQCWWACWGGYTLANLENRCWFTYRSGDGFSITRLVRQKIYVRKIQTETFAAPLSVPTCRGCPSESCAWRIQTNWRHSCSSFASLCQAVNAIRGVSFGYWVTMILVANLVLLTVAHHQSHDPSCLHSL